MTIQNYGTTSGIADLPYSDNTGQYDSDKDAAVVNYGTFWYPELTFAHELGHTFGAHHDNVFTGPPNLVGCYRGAIFGNGGIDRTLMATLYSTNSIPSSSSAMVFSDPNNTYEYNGQQVSIGNAGRNNKNVVEYTLCYEGVDPQSVQQEIYARFLNNNDQKDNTIVYPNPVKNFINIENSNNLESIELISIDGRIIREIKSSKSINNLEVSFLEGGAYFLKLKYPDLIKTVKFIKQ